MHIYIHTFIVAYATNFTPRCLIAISILNLPSKQPEAINRHLAMNELHTQLPDKPWQKVSLSWAQFICFQIFQLQVEDITLDLINEKFK